MSDRVKAHGHASWAVLHHLHGLRVPALDIGQPISHAAGRQADRETAIKLALAPTVGAMLSAGGKPEHWILRSDPGVAHALDLTGKDGDAAVDAIEPIYLDTQATLASPRIWSSVASTAKALMRTAGGRMEGNRVAAVIRQSLAERHHSDFAPPMPPRKVYVTDGPER
jgi:hypothetical protein